MFAARSRVSLDIKWTLLERGLFGALHVMGRRASIRRWTAYAMLIIEFIQLLLFILSPDGIFPWAKNEVLQQIFTSTSIVNGVSFLSIKGTAKFAYFCFSLAWVLFSILLLLIVAMQVIKNNFSTLIPLRMFRVATLLASTVLYIPLLRGLLTAIDCDEEQGWFTFSTSCLGTLHVSFIVVTIILALFLSSLSLLVASVYYDSKPFTPNLMARSTGRVQSIMILIKTVLTVTSGLGDAIPMSVIAALCVSSGVVWFAFGLYYLPYLHPRMNSLALGLSASFLWASLCLAITSMFTFVLPSVGFLFLCLGMPFIFMNGSAAGALRFMNARHPKRLRAPAAVDLRIRFLLYRATMKTGSHMPPERLAGPRPGDAGATGIELKQKHSSGVRQVIIMEEDPPSDKEDNDIDMPDSQLWKETITAAEEELNQGLKVFPKSAHMHMLAASFYRFIRPNWHLEKKEMAAVASCSTVYTLDLRFRIFQRLSELLERDTKPDGGATPSNLDTSVVSRVRLQQSVNKADQAAAQAASSMVSFWRELCEPAPSSTSLHFLSEGVSAALAEATTSYKAAISLAPNSAVLLKKYGRFLRYAMNDPAASRQVLHEAREKARDTEKLKTPALQTFEFLKKCSAIESSVSFDEVAVIRSSLEINEATTVIDANANFFKLSGYTKSEILGQSIDILIPEPLGTLHHMFVSRFMASGRTRVLNTTRRTVIRTREGLLQPIMQSVRVDNGNDGVSAIMHPLRTVDGLLMFTWPDGILRGVCARTRSMLGVDIERMDREQVHIQQHFPNVVEDIQRAVRGKMPLVGRSYERQDPEPALYRSHTKHASMSAATLGIPKPAPEPELPSWGGLTSSVVMDVMARHRSDPSEHSLPLSDRSSSAGSSPIEAGEEVTMAPGSPLTVQGRFQHVAMKDFALSIVFLTWRPTAQKPYGFLQRPSPVRSTEGSERFTRFRTTERTQREPRTVTASVGNGAQTATPTGSTNRAADIELPSFVPSVQAFSSQPKDDSSSMSQKSSNSRMIAKDNFNQQAPAPNLLDSDSDASETKQPSPLEVPIVTGKRRSTVITTKSTWHSKPPNMAAVYSLVRLQERLPTLLSSLTRNIYVNPVVKPLLRIRFVFYMLMLYVLIGGSLLVHYANGFAVAHASAAVSVSGALFTTKHLLYVGLLPVQGTTGDGGNETGPLPLACTTDRWHKALRSAVQDLGDALDYETKTFRSKHEDSVASMTIQSGPVAAHSPLVAVTPEEATRIIHSQLMLYLHDVKRVADGDFNANVTVAELTEYHANWIASVVEAAPNGYYMSHFSEEVAAGQHAAETYTLVVEIGIGIWATFIVGWTVFVALGALLIVRTNSNLLSYFLALPTDVIQHLLLRSIRAATKLQDKGTGTQSVYSNTNSESKADQRVATLEDLAMSADDVSAVTTKPSFMQAQDAASSFAANRVMKHPKLFHFRLFAKLFLPLALIISINIAAMALSFSLTTQLQQNVDTINNFESFRYSAFELLPRYSKVRHLCADAYMGHPVNATLAAEKVKLKYHYDIASAAITNLIINSDTSTGNALMDDGGYRNLWSGNFCAAMEGREGFGVVKGSSSVETISCASFGNGIFQEGLEVGISSVLLDIALGVNSMSYASCRRGLGRTSDLERPTAVYEALIAPGLSYSSSLLVQEVESLATFHTIVLCVWCLTLILVLFILLKRVYQPTALRTNSKISQTLIMLLLLPTSVIKQSPKIARFMNEVLTKQSQQSSGSKRR